MITCNDLKEKYNVTDKTHEDLQTKLRMTKMTKGRSKTDKREMNSPQFRVIQMGRTLGKGTGII
jgi:hypothetical protein